MLTSSHWGWTHTTKGVLTLRNKLARATLAIFSLLVVGLIFPMAPAAEARTGDCPDGTPADVEWTPNGQIYDIYLKDYRPVHNNGSATISGLDGNTVTVRGANGYTVQLAEFFHDRPGFSTQELVMGDPATYTKPSSDGWTAIRVRTNHPGCPPLPSTGGADDSYWIYAKDGGVFSYGAAAFHGSTGNMRLNAPVVGMAAHPKGCGYWLFAQDGGVFSFGCVKFWGSTGNMRLNAPVVGMSVSASGNGYRLVASDGGVFTFGDASFIGSAANSQRSGPIVDLAPTPSGNGYWLITNTSQIFRFGDAGDFSGPGLGPLNDVIGMASNPAGNGYWIARSNGSVYAYGQATSFGGATNVFDPIIDVAPHPENNGYWLLDAGGGVRVFGATSWEGDVKADGLRLNQPAAGMTAA